MRTIHPSFHHPSSSNRLGLWLLLACLGALVCLPVACAEPPLKPGDPADIVAAIREVQKQQVRESLGEYAGECFTDADLTDFQRAKVAEKAAAGLRSQRKFMEGVLALRSKPALDRGSFLNTCRKPLRPTWAELGRISAEGQTGAGRKAELALANAVADLVEELVRLPEEKLQETFQRK